MLGRTGDLAGRAVSLKWSFLEKKDDDSPSIVDRRTEQIRH